MGRREIPIDLEGGPVQRFAHGLRELRGAADGMTYREMARRTHYSVTTLAAAASGDQLPSLPVTLAYVEACGGDTSEWEARWLSDGVKDFSGARFISVKISVARERFQCGRSV
ncbi:helix-turn-helix domain-containing protein [Streptomyces sp. NPDC057638]|uniref:helix-turn-helix domain-containing protein n=1 Tax=Streptomyces sp. NPDC057638 TaxID=3346190 RepID=UPI00367970C8